MSISDRPAPSSGRFFSDRPIALGGALLLVGLVLNGIQRTVWHPVGAEDDHASIFTEYADSDAWVATHLAEFVLVLVALAGLLVLCRALRPQTPLLALLAGAAVVASSATWAALQAVDGVTLKQAVDAWAGASGAEKSARFGDAETVRWIEWALQSYFRIVLGIALTLLGAAAVASRLLPTWLGLLLAGAGLLSAAIGISIGYAGLESGFQDAVGIALQLAVLGAAVGLVVVGRRDASGGPALRGG